MLCPVCGQETRVIETDKLESTVLRVRWCKNPKCRQTFETQEAVSGLSERDAFPKNPPRMHTPGPGPRAKGPGQGHVSNATGR
ncbi:hypothetical protein JCM15519_26940 [Fundidesulfovibrio butyratiphilus]